MRLKNEPLVKALRLSFTHRTFKGFYLRAESFFNVATHVDAVGASNSYGGKSLHDQAHGESFLSLLENRFSCSGFYLMDEPEAASPQRQLSFVVLLHDLLSDNDDIQFLIATHSPILLAYPGAQILSFDGGVIHPIDYSREPALPILEPLLGRAGTLHEGTLYGAALNSEVTLFGVRREGAGETPFDLATSCVGALRVNQRYELFRGNAELPE